MFTKHIPALLVSCTLIFHAYALEVRNANETLNMPANARHAALANSVLAQNGDAASIYTNPASLLHLRYNSFSLSHAEHFESSRYDALQFNMNLDTNSSMAFSLARFAETGIPETQEGAVYEGSDYPTFDIQDLVFSGAFAQRWSFLELGAAVHFLHRQLDQQGFGYRMDLSANTEWKGLRSSILWKGISTSGVIWENSTEWEPSDIFLGLSYQHDVPYFYGSFTLAAQTQGIFQNTGKSNALIDDNTLAGDDLFNDPGTWIQSSGISLEYQSQYKFSLRGGLEHIHSLKSYSFGAGLRQVFKVLDIDYGFMNHPELNATHRVSIQIFPKFLNPNMQHTPQIKRGQEPQRKDIIPVKEDQREVIPADSISPPDKHEKSSETLIEELEEALEPQKKEDESKPEVMEPDVSQTEANDIEEILEPSEPKPEEQKPNVESKTEVKIQQPNVQETDSDGDEFEEVLE